MKSREKINRQKNRRSYREGVYMKRKKRHEGERKGEGKNYDEKG